MKSINKMLLNAEIGDISQILVSLHALQYNGNVHEEYLELFVELLDKTNDNVARAIRCIKFDQDYEHAMTYLEGVGDNIKTLLSYGISDVSLNKVC